ncbi:MAG: hypothetical protein JSW72_08120 [Candidatus Bathyarchaeota archaeon]|nr:MAG: hypothetical protein JSW72_08120 [Candidatus Bathyarchaeota archaeon]
MGWAATYLVGSQTTVGFGVIPAERNKEYATEAASILVDYLFLTKNIVRLQADTSTTNWLVSARENLRLGVSIQALHVYKICQVFKVEWL